MARVTKTNSPAPYNISGAAREIGCAEKTLRGYIRNNQLDGVQYTPAGHVILYTDQVQQARQLFERARRRASRAA
jgi:hypothetical protein